MFSIAYARPLRNLSKLFHKLCTDTPTFCTLSLCQSAPVQTGNAPVSAYRTPDLHSQGTAIPLPGHPYSTPEQGFCTGSTLGLFSLCGFLYNLHTSLFQLAEAFAQAMCFSLPTFCSFCPAGRRFSPAHRQPLHNLPVYIPSISCVAILFLPACLQPLHGKGLFVGRLSPAFAQPLGLGPPSIDSFCPARAVVFHRQTPDMPPLCMLDAPGANTLAGEIPSLSEGRAGKACRR